MSRPALSQMCRRCQTRLFGASSNRPNNKRSFSTVPGGSKNQDADDFSIFEQALRKTRNGPPSSPPAQTSLPATTPSSSGGSSSSSSSSSSSLDFLAQGARAEASTRPSGGISDDEPYHLTVFAHKHNLHITFTEPSRNPILSYSAGNIGLRKAQRGSFDAAYQLSTYAMRKIAEKQWRVGGKALTTNKMLTLSEPEVRERGIEVVLRGYGHGREAFQKALLGNEGKIIKPLIKKVTDGTRLKFGGTRSPQVRRLG